MMIDLSTATPDELWDAAKLKGLSSLPRDRSKGFEGSANSLLKVLSQCLVELRDAGLLDLSWNHFAECLSLDHCEALTKNSKLTQGSRFQLRKLLLTCTGSGQAPDVRRDQFNHVLAKIDKTAICSSQLH